MMSAFQEGLGFLGSEPAHVEQPPCAMMCVARCTTHVVMRIAVNLLCLQPHKQHLLLCTDQANVLVYVLLGMGHGP
jgi:hypothetical protein